MLKCKIMEFDCRLHTIISGGQAGADQAGLFAAKEVGLKTGGHAPNGWRTCHGAYPELDTIFGLTQTINNNYAIRTELNVTQSDATIIFATNFNSPGTLLTKRYTRKHNKPLLEISLAEKDDLKSSKQIADFIIQEGIAVLNVAGNRDKEEQFGFHFKNAYDIIKKSLEILDNDGRLDKEK